jgi:hypothetical protein
MCGSEDRYGGMNPSGMLTAAQAIRKECRFCVGAAQSHCTTTVCKLHPAVFKCRSSVKRIRAHCLECAAQDIGETRFEAIATCTGHLLRENGNTARWIAADGVERGICFLHPYRFGRNPTRTKYPSPPKRKPSATPARGRNTAQGSTIPPESGRKWGRR